MSRSPYNNTKAISPDHKYNNLLVSKMINIFMQSGKKLKSSKIIYHTLKLIKQKYLVNPLPILEHSINTIRPLVSTHSKKVGGTHIKVPYRLPLHSSINIALKWLKQTIISNYKPQSVSISLFKEIINTYNGNSQTLLKKRSHHHTVLTNRAFTFYN